MLAQYFEAGGPVMYAVLGAWIIVFAGVLERSWYMVVCAMRRPRLRAVALASAGHTAAASHLAQLEHVRARQGLARIEAVSQLATSIGLFGTVLGIARSFFARGAEAGLAAPEALASGLSTALFTTIAGLIVFLFGQGALIVYREWLTYCERGMERLFPGEPVPGGGFE